MQTVTIACPVSLYDDNINVETAPLYKDSTGSLYYVASGQLEDTYETTEPVKASPTRVNIVTEVEGLTALAMMELTIAEESSIA